jgi:catechol 2,3-dioxygenase-like lactoylglutathione lyase family enzyme
MSAARLVTGVDFVTVFTQDFDAASAFYGGTLGLECSTRYGQVPGAEYETGNLTLQLLDSAVSPTGFAPRTHPLALHVDDVGAARAELESQGIEFMGETIDSGVCHMALFSDPDGNLLMLHHRYAPR